MKNDDNDIVIKMVEESKIDDWVDGLITELTIVLRAYGIDVTDKIMKDMMKKALKKMEEENNRW